MVKGFAEIVKGFAVAKIRFKHDSAEYLVSVSQYGVVLYGEGTDPEGRTHWDELACLCVSDIDNHSFWAEMTTALNAIAQALEGVCHERV